MLYMVASIMGAAATGPLKAQLGGRRAYAVGAFLFLLGSAACAIAPTMLLFVAARALQGFGGGMVLARSMALISEIFPEPMKKPLLALVSSTWGVAALIGPALGGIFAAIHFWRGAFWFNLPLVLGFIAVAWVTLPADHDRTARRMRFPYRRLGLLTTGVMSVGMTSQWQATEARLGLILLALILVWWTMLLDRTGENRLFPTQPFSLMTMTGSAYWTMFLSSMTHTFIGVYLPLSLQILKGVSPVQAGYMTATLAFSWTLGSLLTTRWQGLAMKGAMIGGVLFCILGLAAMTYGIEIWSAAMLSACNALVGLGLGMSNIHVVGALMRHATPGEESITASSIPTIRSLGIAFGAAGAGAIANWAGLSDALHPDEVRRAIFWVLGLGTLAPVAALVCVLRLDYLLGRHERTAQSSD